MDRQELIDLQLAWERREYRADLRMARICAAVRNAAGGRRHWKVSDFIGKPPKGPGTPRRKTSQELIEGFIRMAQSQAKAQQEADKAAPIKGEKIEL